MWRQCWLTPALLLFGMAVSGADNPDNPNTPQARAQMLQAIRDSVRESATYTGREELSETVMLAMASVPQLFGLLSSPGWTMESLVEEANRLGFRWLVIHDTEELRALQPIEAMVRDLDEADQVTARSEGLVLVDLHAEGDWPRRPYTGLAAMDLSGTP